jgi:hypothetical protein
MTQDYKHPITPPPELVQQWEEDWHHSKVKHIEFEPYIAAQAAQWGADQELEACCEWVRQRRCLVGGSRPWITPSEVGLRAARRPKPPSLKEQALTSLRRIQDNEATYLDAEHIRRALEQLSDHK